MSVVLSKLLYAGLRVAGITGRPGRGPASDQLNDALDIFNRMVGSWSNIRLNIYSIAIAQYTLVANQQTYTIGPGGTGPYWFNAARPINIEHANLIISSNPNPVRRPISLLDNDQWAAKRVQQVYGPPLDLYDDYNVPFSNLYFWPIPNQNYPFELHTWQTVPSATAAGDTIDLPPGYEEAIVYNLARRLATQFPKQAAMSAEAIAIARTSLLAIQSRNTNSPRLVNDAAGLGKGRGRRADFNWIDGQAR